MWVFRLEHRLCPGALVYHSGHFYNHQLVIKAPGQKPWFSRPDRLGSATVLGHRLKGWWCWKAGRGDLSTVTILERVCVCVPVTPPPPVHLQDTGMTSRSKQKYWGGAEVFIIKLSSSKCHLLGSQLESLNDTPVNCQSFPIAPGVQIWFLSDGLTLGAAL